MLLFQWFSQFMFSISLSTYVCKGKGRLVLSVCESSPNSHILYFSATTVMFLLHYVLFNALAHTSTLCHVHTILNTDWEDKLCVYSFSLLSYLNGLSYCRQHIQRVLLYCVGVKVCRCMCLMLLSTINVYVHLTYINYITWQWNKIKTLYCQLLVYLFDHVMSFFSVWSEVIRLASNCSIIFLQRGTEPPVSQS